MGDALTPTPRVTLAFDAGVTAGLGHRRRMDALAAALAEQGATCTLRPVDELDGAGPIDVIVVDSYRCRPDQVRVGARAVVAIDDLERDLAVDLVVDPCPGASAVAHGKAAAVLAGAAYAPLDARLAELATPAPHGGRQEILIATGGADLEGHGYAIARAVADRCRGEHGVRLAVGPGTHREEVAGVEAVHRSDGLGPELARADVVVTAGGVTLLESLALGRPTVVVALYDNQCRQTAGAAGLGAAVAAEPGGAGAAVDALLDSVDVRVALSARARAVVDGRGAGRVAEAVIGLA